MATPEVPTTYEHDYREVLIILDSMKEAMGTHSEEFGVEETYIQRMQVDIESAHGYPVGTLTYEDEQWRFTPYAEWAET